MSWQEIVGHQDVEKRIRNTIVNGRLASTYLFVGKKGIGKRTFALKLAQSILCETTPETLMDPCGVCPACQQVTSESHPDLILVSKPKDKSFIPVEAFIGDRDHRRQVGLCHDIGLKPFRGGRKIAIIDDADHLNQESANSLLKLLEEPPPKSLLILIGTSAKRQLPTIVSRSQVVRFSDLSFENCKSLLEKQDLPEGSDIEQLALAADGSIDLAIQLADPDMLEFRANLFGQLASLDPGSNEFAATVASFVDSGGKDSASKRVRMGFVADLAIQFYRAWMVSHARDQVLDNQLAGAIEDATGNFQTRIAPELGSNPIFEAAAECISRTIDAQWHAASNAQPINLVNAWMVDVGRICRGENVVILK